MNNAAIYGGDSITNKTWALAQNCFSLKILNIAILKKFNM